MAAGSLSPDPMITDLVRLDDAADALARLVQDRGTQIRVSISVKGD